MTSSNALYATAASILMITAGCGRAGSGDPPLTHTEKIDVGGAVLYANDPDERLSGVTVTIEDLDGDQELAITGSGGLWTITNLRPGVYTETYAAPGYESFTATFGLDAGGPDDIANTFVPRPDVALSETGLRATVSGTFTAELRDGDSPLDGFGGAAFTWSESAASDITVTFSRLLLPTDGGDVRARRSDGGGNTVEANRSDTATQTIFTLPAAELVSELDADSDPLTFIRIEMDVQAVTPIHEDIESFSAELRYNAMP